MAGARRLAAILVADVVGYSRLIEINEAATLAAVRIRHQEILAPLVSKHDGRIVKFMGDGALAEFSSAVGAVSCAADIQSAMHVANEATPNQEPIVLRVGVNLGDIIFEDGDVYGDGVNIAARLEALAGPGEIYISNAVFGQVRSKLKMQFEDVGEHTLKNISEPMRVYRVGGRTDEVNYQSKINIAATASLSIVVLPFLNMSQDPEQEYFSDGITEDIITDLSKVSSLKVISRNTAFTFKGRAVDLRQLSRQLDVGLVLEGSVRKSEGRVRITAQLIDAAKDSHIWAERYDRDLRDIFTLQDEISQAIVHALKVRILPEEKRAIAARSTHNAEAYQLYLLARHYLTQRGVRNLEIALRFSIRAIELDDNYARAWALVALCHSYLFLSGRSADSGLSAADRALAIDGTLAEAHSARGRILAGSGKYEEALIAHRDSLRLDPDSFDVEHNFGLTCMEMGDYTGAIKHMERAAELFEADHTSLDIVALSYRSLGMKEKFEAASRRAIERIEKEIAARPENANAILHGAIALARIGQRERALDWLARAQIIEPEDAMGQYNAACAKSQLGDGAGALTLLASCLPQMPPHFVAWAKQDPDLAPLRDDVAFGVLMSRIQHD